MHTLNCPARPPGRQGPGQGLGSHLPPLGSRSQAVTMSLVPAGRRPHREH